MCNLLWRYLAELESLFGDVDGALRAKIRVVWLRLPPGVCQSLAALNPLWSFLPERMRATRGSSSRVFEPSQSLEALSQAPLAAIRHPDISHVDIIKHFIGLVQNLQA